ncbi:hypothetical protein NQ314_018311 [Rhamnusium bicolor]|uniref:MULE transposase domain-containing protein n=1 Tax=Rhamnusium bicolor TaxID=1586634 RepID=A0AAV8WR37_9CUCU|nr:hypothetical protein NQ314_018311 [Rhamnusium bicolor]
MSKNDGVRHRNDVSVELWIEEYKQVGNSTLIYKKQGDDHVLFEKNDFCLIVFNHSQEYMLKTFGKNTVCVDSTHGLNGYDFELTTVMIIDEFGEGFPGACMFTNRKDTLHEFFFEQIQLKTGIIFTNTFMSDITSVFYNAWEKVMAPAKNQLFCSWHIDHAWRANLNKISNSEKRGIVYKILKALVSELCETDFLKELKEFREIFR